MSNKLVVVTADRISNEQAQTRIAPELQHDSLEPVIVNLSPDSLYYPQRSMGYRRDIATSTNDLEVNLKRSPHGMLILDRYPLGERDPELVLTHALPLFVGAAMLARSCGVPIFLYGDGFSPAHPPEETRPSQATFTAYQQMQALSAVALKGDLGMINR